MSALKYDETLKKHKGMMEMIQGLTKDGIMEVGALQTLVVAGTRTERLLRMMREFDIPPPQTVMCWMVWDNAFACTNQTLRVWLHGFAGPHSKGGDGISEPVCGCKPEHRASSSEEELQALLDLKKHLTGR